MAEDSGCAKILGCNYPVLDEGFIRVVDTMGDDHAIVQAARVSYGDGTKTLREDRGLIRYLISHWHTSPFEMCEIKLHVKLPIFVARQWLRHRTANVNEYSARYSVLKDDFFLPSELEIAPQSSSNNQGRSEVISMKGVAECARAISEHSTEAYGLYERLINSAEDGGITETGIARELARMVLPVNVYTEFYWKIDLHNLMHFIRLRADNHAQKEIIAYADVLREIMSKWVPHTYEAFCDYRLNARSFAKHELEALSYLLSGSEPPFEQLGFSKREIDEFRNTISNLKGASTDDMIVVAAE